MIYWQEMENERGFNYGVMPAGVEAYRDVYIQVMNKLLERHGSKTRVFPYDNPGIYNWCMIKCTHKDSAFHAALAEALEMELDGLIHVVISDELAECLEQI